MVVADVGTHQRPNVFLRVQVRAGRRKEDGFNAGMRRQHVGDWLTLVPVGAVSKQQDGLVGIAGKQVS